MIGDGGELALVDVREELIFSQRHLLLARSVPLSRLRTEVRAAGAAPRDAHRAVRRRRRCSPRRAAAILARNGYSDLAILDGGVDAWAAAGFELFSGVNVPSKAFGEYIEHERGTPSIAAAELEQLLRDKADIVVLDSRPFDEYSRVSIPTGVNVPGAELVLRAREIAPSPDTMIVVNCAGRTRSIIGAQSLINAGVPNKVVALRNGTMGWSLAGFACDSGKNRRAPDVSQKTLDWARTAALQRGAKLRRRTHRSPDARSLAQGRDADALSVRRPRSRRVRSRPRRRRGLGAGRPAGAGDRPICRHARRAHRAGRRRRGARGDDRVVAAPNGLERRFHVGRGRIGKGPPKPAILDGETQSSSAIDCAALDALLSRNAATVVDLAPSRDYLGGSHSRRVVCDPDAARAAR